jgi:hypothetical protein
MLIISLVDIIPAVLQLGYECEMQFTDESAALGTFAQVYCAIAKNETPWTVCKYNAVQEFFSEFTDQIGLFFGLILMSSPKPAISYVKITRYLMIFATIESLIALPYYCLAYAQGAEFIKSSSSCIFEVSSGNSDSSQITSVSLKGIIYETLCIILYCGFIWGTYVLVPVLKRGGTGDERVAGSDVLALVRRSPPKLLVLTSAFNFAPLRIASILLCLGLVGMCVYNGFNNLLRMISWCGQFEMERVWCRWPYGILSLCDQTVCILFSLYTVHQLVFLRPDKRMPPLSIWWAYIAFSSFVFLIGAVYIISAKYPAYWLSGMRSDLWIYYTRFWFGLTLVVFTRSISIIRVAGGVGNEDDRGASDLVYANLSDRSEDNPLGLALENDSDADSLTDLLGLSGTALKSTRLVPLPQPDEPEAWKSESSRVTSGIGTPLGVIPSQAFDGAVENNNQ